MTPVWACHEGLNCKSCATRIKVTKELEINLLRVEIQRIVGSFPFLPPSLVGAYYMHPSDARGIFLPNDLQCNGTCSVTRGCITDWGGGGGGHKWKRSELSNKHYSYRWTEECCTNIADFLRGNLNLVPPNDVL